MENTVKELKLEELEMVNGGDFLDTVIRIFAHMSEGSHSFA